ncbi:MAG: ExbD/TolR family protein [Gammaproteobacteria bacterium]
MQFDFSSSQAQQPRALISLTPLIDVVFILLLFFLLASSFLEWHTIKLSTPATQGMVANSSGGAVLIRLGSNGVLDINGRPVLINELPSKLTQFLDKKPDQKILIRPAKGVPLQPVVSVLDAVKKAGGQNVSLTR